MPALSPVKPVSMPHEPWLVRHWQQVLLALAAAVVAGILSALVVSRLKKAEERGWEQISYAFSQAAQGRRAEALKSLDGVLSAHRSGPVAVQGLLMKSDLLLAEGRKEDAVAAAREAKRQAASPEYGALASIALAYALDESGQPKEAADEYDLFLKDFPDHFLAPRAYAQVGRLRAASGDAAAAKEAYEKLVTLYPSTVWARDAKASLEGLK